MDRFLLTVCYFISIVFKLKILNNLISLLLKCVLTLPKRVVDAAGF